MSRLEWPKDQYFPPCVLRFRDGWEPPVFPSVTPSREQELTQLADTLANAEIQRQEELKIRLAQEVCTCPPTGHVLLNNRNKF